MQIDESDGQLENAYFLIAETFEPVSNATIERPSDEQKHSSQRIVTDEGIQSDESDEP
jgi:hypothetical protein